MGFEPGFVCAHILGSLHSEKNQTGGSSRVLQNLVNAFSHLLEGSRPITEPGTSRVCWCSSRT